MYEFLSATSKTPSPTAPESATTYASTPPSISTNPVPEDVTDPHQVRNQLIARMKQREHAIKADAANKKALWRAELDALRTITLQPSPTDSSPAPGKAPSTTFASYSPPQFGQTAETKPATSAAAVSAAAPPTTASPATPTASAAAAPAAPAASAPSDTATAPTEPPPVDGTPAAAAVSVSDLYGPPPSKEEEKEESSPWRFQNFVEGVREAVEDVREAVEDAVEDVRDAVEDVVEDVIDVFDGDDEEAEKQNKAPETAPKSEPEATQVAEEDKQDRSIGEVIIDAIVEGVDAPEGESGQPSTDKSDLIELVDSGKVKNLTVTKLRRLLTQNGLKTSGRKAELIARLTSFAKAK